MSEIVKPDHQETVAAIGNAPVGGGFKRTIDIVVSAVAIVLMLPLLSLCAMAMWLTSGGPIIARQRCVGFRGRSFYCFRFETSASSASDRSNRIVGSASDSCDSWRFGNEPATRIGAVLRKAGLDELPQLFNVLRGDMSIVGPQPIRAGEIDHYAGRATAYLS